MGVEEGSRKGSEGRSDPYNSSCSLQPRSAFCHLSILYNHGACGGHNDRYTGLRQRHFSKESPESSPQRSLISLCGELYRDLVLFCGLHFSYELWKEDPRFQKQTQGELATWRHGFSLCSQNLSS